MKQSALDFRPQILSTNKNIGIYRDRLCNANAIHQIIKNGCIPIMYLQLKLEESQNDYLTQTLVILAGFELKKNKLLLQKIELTRLF